MNIQPSTIDTYVEAARGHLSELKNDAKSRLGAVKVETISERGLQGATTLKDRFTDQVQQLGSGWLPTGVQVERKGDAFLVKIDVMGKTAYAKDSADDAGSDISKDVVGKDDAAAAKKAVKSGAGKKGATTQRGSTAKAKGSNTKA